MNPKKIAGTKDNAATRRMEHETEGAASGAIVGAVVGAAAGPAGVAAGADIGGIAGALRVRGARSRRFRASDANPRARCPDRGQRRKPGSAHSEGSARAGRSLFRGFRRRRKLLAASPPKARSSRPSRDEAGHPGGGVALSWWSRRPRGFSSASAS